MTERDIPAADQTPGSQRAELMRFITAAQKPFSVADTEKAMLKKFAVINVSPYASVEDFLIIRRNAGLIGYDERSGLYVPR